MAGLASSPAKGGNNGPGRGGARANLAPKPASAQRGFNSPLYQPSQTLSGRSLANAASGIANAQTQGPISELAKQIATNQQNNQNQQQTDFQYYMQMAQAAKDAVTNQSQIGANLNSTLAGIGANTQSQLAQIGQQQQAGAVGRMNALGLGGDSAAQLAAQTAQQEGIGALNSQTFRQAGANQAANYQGASANQLGTTGLAGTEQIGNLARAGTLQNEPLEAKIAALEQKKGALTATALGQLRTLERNYQIASGALGVKQGALANARAYDQGRLRAIANGQAITRQNDLAKQAQAAAALAEKTHNDALTQAYHEASLAAKGQGKPLSGSSQARLYGQISQAEGLVREWQAAAKQYQQWKANPSSVPTGVAASFQKYGAPPLTQAQISSQLAAKYHFPPLFIQAAYELAGWGHITPATARQMRAWGLRGGSYTVAPPPPTGAARAVGNAPSSKLGL